MRFRTSGLYIQCIPPLIVGVCVGVLAAIMGVGGGFIMVPAMIYLLGMPTKVVVGTSLFQIIFVTGFTTMLHATTNYTVDIVLAVLLLVGGVIGAQIGTRIGVKMKAEQLRILLAIMVLAVCGKLALDLLVHAKPNCIRWAAPGVGIDVCASHALLACAGLACRWPKKWCWACPGQGGNHHQFRRLGNPGLWRGQTRVADPRRHLWM